MVNHMLTALERDGQLKSGCVCSYVFQPVIKLETGYTDHVEMLTRLNYGSCVSVEEFFTDVEQGDSILSYDFSNLLRACFLLSCVSSGELHPGMSVNISTRSIADPWLQTFVQHRLHELLVAPDQLIIEITETSRVLSRRVLKQFAQTIQEAGFRLAFDDFGTGHHNFEDILLVRPDIVKIDGQWLKNPGQCMSGGNYNLADTVRILKGLGITLVAEHISNKEMYETALSYGFDLIQGNFLARPRQFPF